MPSLNIHYDGHTGDINCRVLLSDIDGAPCCRNCWPMETQPKAPSLGTGLCLQPGPRSCLGLDRLTEAELEDYVEQAITDVRRQKRGEAAS